MAGSKGNPRQAEDKQPPVGTAVAAAAAVNFSEMLGAKLSSIDKTVLQSQHVRGHLVIG